MDAQSARLPHMGHLTTPRPLPSSEFQLSLKVSLLQRVGTGAGNRRQRAISTPDCPKFVIFLNSLREVGHGHLGSLAAWQLVAQPEQAQVETCRSLYAVLGRAAEGALTAWEGVVEWSQVWSNQLWMSVFLAIANEGEITTYACWIQALLFPLCPPLDPARFDLCLQCLARYGGACFGPWGVASALPSRRLGGRLGRDKNSLAKRHTSRSNRTMAVTGKLVSALARPGLLIFVCAFITIRIDIVRLQLTSCPPSLPTGKC
ncbi:hypothetical protein B0J13DRAFT_552194 [Dactylonectria estremocensis]|uniref:Uncharacterized protein n=1 Tax=Dactylonectria estremocensis TaxID=1079267 RepID=A0A9P9JB40_9HYPO|nr:hypothetical protein B0J13DRAFT_552194 [Dactylonectria estremocensis]